MPVLVIADLHLDFWLQDGRDPFASLDPKLLAFLDGLIIAGDMSNKPKVRWPIALKRIGRYVDPARIHVLPGNHDFYDHILDGEDRLAGICAEAGANFLQKSEIVIGDLRFLGCTLWTDFALHGDPSSGMRVAQNGMNDYRYIRIGPNYRRIRPSDTAFIHAGHRTWLEEQLSVSFPGRTIVVTHHCPHPGLLGAERRDVGPAYASNLVPLIERFQPEAWLFGHTHEHFADAQVGRTRVFNVSLGYPGEVSPEGLSQILLRGLVATPPLAGPVQ
jgi:3',5'-cyclic AMP phosphodiesterase CpdA